jgi:Pyruvate/2-oxoacid:ferredoxin oxidoreductase delta subunit
MSKNRGKSIESLQKHSDTNEETLIQNLVNINEDSIFIKPPTMAELEANNCFYVTMFCIESAFINYSHFFLEHAFEKWKSLEYCAISFGKDMPQLPLVYDSYEVQAVNNQEL